MKRSLPLLALGVLRAATVQAQEPKTVAFPDTLVLVGPGPLPQHGSIKGNCYGPCPDFTGPGDIPDFTAEPVAPPPATAPVSPSAAAGPIALSPGQAEMANEMNASQAEREGAISRIPSTGSVAGGVAIVNGFTQGLTSQKVLPQTLRDRNLLVLEALSGLTASGQGWVGEPKIAIPAVLGEAEFRQQFHDKLLDPLFKDMKSDNRQQFYDGFTNVAVQFYTAAVMAARDEFFPPLMAKLDDLRKAARARIDHDSEFVESRIAADHPAQSVRDAALSMAFGTRSVKFDVDALVVERMPAYLKQNAYLLSPLIKPAGLASPMPAWPSPANIEVATAFGAIDAVVPVSAQGVRAKDAARRVALAANAMFGEADKEKAKRLLQLSVKLLDVATSVLPIVGPVRFLYEGVTGTDAFTGRVLSDNERAVRVLLAATGGVLQVGGALAIESVLQAAIENEAETGLSQAALDAVEAMEKRLGAEGTEMSSANAKRLRKLFDAIDEWRPTSDRNGLPIDLNEPGGVVSEHEADELGDLLLGEQRSGYQNTRGDVNLESPDGLAQYRMPRLKRGGVYEANYQIRLSRDQSSWAVNGHLTIKPPSP